MMRSFSIVLVISNGAVSNVLLEDYEAILKFISAEKQLNYVPLFHKINQPITREKIARIGLVRGGSSYF